MPGPGLGTAGPLSQLVLRTHEEVQKAQFSVEGTGLGKGGAWPRFHKDRAQCLGPQGRTCHSDHLEASWWGKRVLALEYPVYSLTSAV